MPGIAARGTRRSRSGGDDDDDNDDGEGEGRASRRYRRARGNAWTACESARERSGTEPEKRSVRFSGLKMAARRTDSRRARSHRPPVRPDKLARVARRRAEDASRIAVRRRFIRLAVNIGVCSRLPRAARSRPVGKHRRDARRRPSITRSFPTIAVERATSSARRPLVRGARFARLRLAAASRARIVAQNGYPSDGEVPFNAPRRRLAVTRAIPTSSFYRVPAISRRTPNSRLATAIRSIAHPPARSSIHPSIRFCLSVPVSFATYLSFFPPFRVASITPPPRRGERTGRRRTHASRACTLRRATDGSS